MRLFKKPKYIKYVNTALLTTFLLITSYALFAPVDVIEVSSWIITTDKSEYYQDEQISAVSSYKKLRNVSGVAERFLDCRNGTPALVRYPVNAADATRKAGTNATGVFISIPTIKPIPTECAVVIVIKYDIYPLRDHTETRSSAFFKVIPRPEGSVVPQNRDSVTERSTGNTNNTQNDIVIESDKPSPTPEEPEPESILPTICLPLTNICIND